ncbi:RraA family protein [Streptacidiphilus monticola]|uniref:Putative 4-hydroxy-4-methyl-2-oxoglutarate aldolase n=1 Tax=Streptacidiphilus monticola TaxID=2161674 RepID=A0ABW1FUR4_9ACTN
MTARRIPPTTTLADLLGPEQVLDPAIHSLWTPVPRVSGPAYTVRCPPGDNLMLHAAIHRAPHGSVIVADAGADTRWALAGGNVCAVARRRGIAGFVLDGVVRDIAEITAMGFPVFARGVVPIPGAKKAVEPLDTPVDCGGVRVRPGDLVVADEDGIVTVPAQRTDRTLAAAHAKLAAEAAEGLDQWEAAHRARIEQLLTGRQ